MAPRAHRWFQVLASSPTDRYTRAVSPAIPQKFLPWVRFEPAPANTAAFFVSSVHEDVVAAAKLAREQIQPRLFERESVALDFRNVDVCTQSFLHALMYEAIRVSWAVQTPIYVENARPAVRAGIDLVDNYAQGG